MEQYLIHYSVEQFQSDIRKIVAETIREHQPKEPVKQLLYDRNEIKEKFHVSYPTLNRWNKEGILEVTKVGGRVLYTLESIEKALNKGTPIKYRRNGK